MKLWYETHATTVDNERGIASGHLDVALSDLGRVQAAELGRRYAAKDLRAVYTSDLSRAVATAEIAFSERGIAQVRDPRLRECDYGDWSGCSTDALQSVRLRYVHQPFPNGESFADVVRRVEHFLGELKTVEGSLLVIAHRAPWYALEHLLRGADLAEIVAAPWEWQPGWEYEL